jgi:hypothetical protein
MPDDITVDKDKFDALLRKIAHSKPTSLDQIKSINASAEKTGRSKRGRPKPEDSTTIKDQN